MWACSGPAGLHSCTVPCKYKQSLSISGAWSVMVRQEPGPCEIRETRRRNGDLSGRRLLYRYVLGQGTIWMEVRKQETPARLVLPLRTASPAWSLKFTWSLEFTWPPTHWPPTQHDIVKRDASARRRGVRGQRPWGDPRRSWPVGRRAVGGP